LLNIGSRLAVLVQFIFLSHDVDWRKQGAPIEHVMARGNRFDKDVLENASVKNRYYNIPEMMALRHLRTILHQYTGLFTITYTLRML
jgi:hypothetical protein